VVSARRGLALFTLMLAVASLWGLLRNSAAPHGAAVLVAGGDGGGLPRATPADEGFADAALALATAQAESLHAAGLLVLHHGHLVLEHYASGARAGTLVAGGAMSEAVVALLTGLAARDHGLELPSGSLEAGPAVAAIAAASHMAYSEFLSRSLWQPLNAAPARLVPGEGSATPGCCLYARAGDWLRVAALMIEGGRFEGTQVVPPEWLARIATPLADDPGRGFGIWLAPAARGAEPFAAPKVVFLRGPGQTRLWLMPTLDLAVLLVDDARPVPGAAPFDETRLPNLVIRALRAQQPTTTQGLGSLVIGH
jgi:CubicO group peptidase (beta-lactamase class C family)